MRLGLRKIRLTLFSLHEVSRFRQVPCTLRLVENGHVVDRWRGVFKSFITEVMHSLNEGLNRLSCLTLAQRDAFALLLLNLVSGQCLTQDRDKRPIP